VRHVHIVSNKVSDAGWVGITTSYAENVVIEKNRIWGSKDQHGIYVANSADNPVIRDNVSFDNRHAGIQINADPAAPGDGIITGAVVSGNILYRNGSGGSAALNLASIRNSRIYNNLIYDNYSQGMASWDDEAGTKYGCKDNLYLHNTIVMPPGARHTVSFRHGSTGNVLKNNILFHLGGKDSISVDRSSLPDMQSDHNLVTALEIASGGLLSIDWWQGTTGMDRNSMIGDPDDTFSDLSGDDYTLRQGSPAIDKGADLGSDVTHDIIGTPRPQGSAHDIGAYEYPAPSIGKSGAPGASPARKETPGRRQNGRGST
jgi:parallel beta-helix repeat protein